MGRFPFQHIPRSRHHPRKRSGWQQRRQQGSWSIFQHRRPHFRQGIYRRFVGHPQLRGPQYGCRLRGALVHRLPHQLYRDRKRIRFFLLQRQQPKRQLGIVRRQLAQLLQRQQQFIRQSQLRQLFVYPQLVFHHNSQLILQQLFVLSQFRKLQQLQRRLALQRRFVVFPQFGRLQRRRSQIITRKSAS